MPIHKLRSRDCGLIATHFASAARADSFVRGTENPASTPWHAGAKDICLRFDRGCPKSRRDVEPGQPSAQIIGERRQRTAMHMAAVVEMTVIDIEFADQLILVGVGNADAEVSRHTGASRGRGHRRGPIRS
jgi:hypothetical protein